jgi:pimeloyl-ACP methyl ester carboxylesterase
VLAHSLIEPTTSEAAQHMLFLHGILGTRANWRAIARRFVERRPRWGAILVDLREHGDSLGLAAPHSLSAAAADLVELERALALPIGGALGHSFGGKVVLEWLRSRQGRPTEAWTIDSSPSRGSEDDKVSATGEVLRALEALPRTWASRDAFVRALTDSGQPEPLAQWLAMNLHRSEDGTRRFGPDLGVIRELIDDYRRTDCWDVVEALPEGATLDLVIAGHSPVFSRSDRERAEALASTNPRLSVHLIEQAGHWVHIDSADALLTLLTSRASPQG